MLKEHTDIVLTGHIPLEALFDASSNSPLRKTNNPGKGLIPGDVGTIVHVYPGGEAFIVEFLEQDGYTAAIADVLASQARPATDEDLANHRFRKKSPV